MTTTATASARERLRAAPFLEGLTDTAFHALARAVEPRTYAAGALLFAQGDPRRVFAIITQGSVAIEKTVAEQTTRLATLGAGEALGEGLLLDESHHGTSALALEPTEVLVLEAGRAKELLREQPGVYAA